MEERLVSFKTAKLAKEKGFDYKVLTIFANEDSKPGNDYKKGDIIIGFPEESFSGEGKYYEVIDNCFYDRHKYLLCPTQSLLQKFLRERYDKHIVIIPYVVSIDETKYYIFRGKLAVKSLDSLFDTYEEALENALKESLLSIK